MSLRQSETLTEAELRIMNVLWGKGSGTVQQVLDSIIKNRSWPTTRCLTTIRVLERKGYLKHLKNGERMSIRQWLGGKRQRDRKSEIL